MFTFEKYGNTCHLPEVGIDFNLGCTCDECKDNIAKAMSIWDDWPDTLAALGQVNPFKTPKPVSGFQFVEPGKNPGRQYYETLYNAVGMSCAAQTDLIINGVRYDAVPTIDAALTAHGRSTKDRMYAFYQLLGRSESKFSLDFIEALTSGRLTGHAFTVKPQYRTQKAKGIAALVKRSLTLSGTSIYQIEDAKPENLIGYFCRPCPKDARHGFVDSRPVNDTETAIQLIAETLAADSESEIITMPFVNAAYSGVWTPGRLALGKGHDGATAGTSALEIPTLGHYPVPQMDAIKAESGVTGNEYVELLYQTATASPVMVQVRNGPALPMERDYIPAQITVDQIIPAKGDLLEWEATMKHYKGIDGVVVDHSEGGSMASHYGVHAFLNGVTILTSRKPKLGETLTPNTEKAKISIDLLRAGFFYAQYWDIDKRDAAFVMLSACHNISAWSGKVDFLLGLGLGCAFRLTTVAALGEYRHNPKSKKKGKPNRDVVYSCYWDRPMQGVTAERLQKALYSFRFDYWPSSYGGMKWYEFSSWGVAIHNALVDGDAEKALEAFNQCVHSAHNGGWAFNKFISESSMNEAAKNPSAPLLKIAPLLHKAVEECKVRNMVTRFNKRSRIAEIADEKPKKVKNSTEKPVVVKVPSKPKQKVAICKILENGQLHIQYGVTKNYQTLDLPIIDVQKLKENLVKWSKVKPSLSGSKADYFTIPVAMSGPYAGLYALWNCVDLTPLNMALKADQPQLEEMPF